VRQSFHPGLKRRKNNGGFTLIEGVVAFSVLVVAVAVCVASLVRMNRVAVEARLRTAAVALAEQKIDEVLGTPWTNDRPAVLTPTETPSRGRSGKSKKETKIPMNQGTLNAPGLRSYWSNLNLNVEANRETIVEEVPPPANRSVRQIRVSVIVDYTYRGKQNSVELRTLRSSDSF
jgi:type II secretory pathway pseudopilin PulG